MLGAPDWSVYACDAWGPVDAQDRSEALAHACVGYGLSKGRSKARDEGMVDGTADTLSTVGREGGSKKDGKLLIKCREGLGKGLMRGPNEASWTAGVE